MQTIAHRTPNRIGSALNAARCAARLSTGDLASRIGISEADFRAYECGAVHPDAATLVALAVTLRVPLSSLFGCGADER